MTRKRCICGCLEASIGWGLPHRHWTWQRRRRRPARRSRARVGQGVGFAVAADEIGRRGESAPKAAALAMPDPSRPQCVPGRKTPCWPQRLPARAASAPTTRSAAVSSTNSCNDSNPTAHSTCDAGFPGIESERQKRRRPATARAIAAALALSVPLQKWRLRPLAAPRSRHGCSARGRLWDLAPIHS